MLALLVAQQGEQVPGPVGSGLCGEVPVKRTAPLLQSDQDVQQVGDAKRLGHQRIPSRQAAFSFLILSIIARSPGERNVDRAFVEIENTPRAPGMLRRPAILRFRLSQDGLEVGLGGRDGLEVEGLLQELQHGGLDEGGQRGPEPDVQIGRAHV